MKAENLEPTDEELAAIARTAQERHARERDKSTAEVRPGNRMRANDEPVPAASAIVPVTSALVVPIRGVRCPKCQQLCSPSELVADPSKCGECRRELDRKNEKAAREREAMLTKIPPAYRGDPVWSNERRPPFLPPEAIHRALQWLAGKSPRLSIFGEQTGSGKSTLAAFVALAGINVGRQWEWVHASDLVPDHEVPEQAKEAVRICRTAPRVIVDGCGKELRGHDPMSGWARRKQEWLHALYGRAHESTQQRFVFTFDMGIERFLEMNGNDASLLRRVAPDDGGKTVIVLHRKDALRTAKGLRQ